MFALLKYVFSKPLMTRKFLSEQLQRHQARKRVEALGASEGLREIDILDLIPSLDETVEPVTHLYGGSMPIDYVLLKALARRYDGKCNYFEIGSWRGESMAVVGPVCKTVTSLSLGDADMQRAGFGGNFIEMQRMFSKDLPNAIHLFGNSRTFAFNSIGRKFDLIFIDGEHSYEAVRSDTANAFGLLKDEKSMIVWHDYTSTYENIDWEILAGILDGTPVDLRKNLFQVSNTLCALFTQTRFPARPRSYPSIPTKKFTVRISATKLA